MRAHFSICQLIAFSLLFACGVSFATAQDTAPSAPAEDPPQEATKAGQIDSYAYVLMKTNRGDILLRLNETMAPITCANFLQYVKEGAYDGTIFHRVIDGFMIQGGGFDEAYEKRPTHEPIKNEWTNGLHNKQGTIAMARTQVPDSATCQFFINDKDNVQLDQPRGGAAYAVFGHVIAGMDVVEEISQTPKENRGGAFGDSPAEAIVIESATKLDLAQAQVFAESRGEPAAVCTEPTTNEREGVVRGRRMREAAERLKQLSRMDMAPEDLPGWPVDRPADGENAGVKWWIIEKGTGAKPGRMEDTVTVHYSGYLVDGTKFDSSVDRGTPYTLPLNRFIQGFTFGVGQMKVGEKKKLLIPGSMGYGQRGNGQIPPNASLVFDVELVEVQPSGPGG